MKTKTLEQLQKENAALGNALCLMRRHCDDLYKSNPGFMGKLCLQDYALWNEALMAMDSAVSNFKKP